MPALSLSITDTALTPPGTYGNTHGAFLEAVRSPWYRLVTDLHDTILTATVEYAGSRGLKALYLPLTTRTITCPSGLGSDTNPVPVTVNGVDTYLPDSMQFLLEYGCQLTARGGYTIMPSFRREVPDPTHLGQFTHSEAEIPGGLEDLVDYVEGYVKALAAAILDRHGGRLAAGRGDVSHLERMVGHERFARVTFDEAVRVLRNDPRYVVTGDAGRNLTRAGELELMRRVGEFTWVTHFDHLVVPFYQAFEDDRHRSARNADLLFGIGEVVGSGERHATGEQVRKALAMHDVPENEYSWYVQMKYEKPLRTAGFGMGVERFLLWVLKHGDIRDIPLVSRVDEPAKWPASIDRP
ncbi:amino acid--tRNA ligase-related protein [Amycolatopsis vancoresmycina]|uniref:amino acid--tRNA ligase-related protein n=1 Tax=Amycolatopsis vancoresmycina TaxID=208444 RepID=UPI003B84B5C3